MTSSRVPSTRRRSFSAVSHAWACSAVRRSAVAVSESTCKRPVSPLRELVAHQLPVGRLVLLVLVSARKEPAQGRVARHDFQQRPQLVGQETQELALLLGQPQEVAAVARRLDAPLVPHQSCCIVAQSPCPWRRATSCSAFSRDPVETTALPSLCTCSISFVAFALL